MIKNKRFTFVCSIQDRITIKDLALKLNRSQGDTIRFLISNASLFISKRNNENDQSFMFAVEKNIKED